MGNNGPMSSPRVRLATPPDASVIAAFNLAMARETEDRALDPARLTRGVSRVLSDAQRGVYRLAELEGRAVGCLLVTREWSDWRDGWFWWIQSVYVDPAARRRGVYRALHESVLEAARQSGDVVGVRLYVETENAPAQDTYEQLGMRRARYVMYETGL
jgi:ribosomal protein S18 acetylase RimI-like enzyme